MAKPTRFPSGLQVWQESTPYGVVGAIDGTKDVYYAEEFVDAGDFIAATPTNWTATVVGSGTRTAPD
ncbi:MAG: hypothetical protein ACRDGA_07615, partial [Bacteroidota bacterium]